MVILLKRKPEPVTDDLPKFTELVHLLFGKRRKQLGAILGRDQELPQGVDQKMRPEVLTVEQLAALARMYH